MIGIGVDFGTSNSAVAWFDGRQLKLVNLEAGSPIMPTATHLDRALATRTGEEAVQQYILENQDRIVEMIPEVLGKSTLLVSDGSEGDPENPENKTETSEHTVYGQALTDRGLQGRLFRGVKRLLGHGSIRRLLVFDQPFRLVALVTPILLRIRKTVERETGAEVERVHVGHPVNFEGHDPYRNQLALSRLGEAYRHAGFGKFHYYPEPVAATLSFLHGRDNTSGGTVLTVDFGGGTLDLSIVRFHDTAFEVLATDGLALGGDHVDQLIFRELLFPRLGKGELWTRMVDGTSITNEFPFEEFENYLLNWAVTYTLNQSHYRSKIASCIASGGAKAEKFERLDDLITHNYSYLVFQAIKTAKADLSSREETLLDIPELDLAIPFTRGALETMMAPMLEQVEEAVAKLLASVKLAPGEIELVIRTGGSSQIVAVRNILERTFPGRVVEHDPFTSVAAGLAIAAYHGYEYAGRDERA